MQKLVIATRGSKLALWQANHVKDQIESHHGGAVAVELLVLKTKGDIILDVPLAKVGGKGLFVKEIEDALLDGRADLAVHSMKDVPVELPEGLHLGVIPVREAVTDLLLSVDYPDLESLPAGAVVGTSSLRRQCQLATLRPDLAVATLRGNVDTRLRKLMDGEFQAIIMATSGMRRLGLSAPCMHELGPPDFLPAVGQGALGLEFRQDRPELMELLGFMDHPPTRVTVEAERGFLTGLNGGCQVPIAAHATTEDKAVRLEGLVADPDDHTGKTVIRRSIQGPARESFALGLSLAEEVLAAGGKAILDRVYRDGVV